MHWQEPDTPPPASATPDVLDVRFRVRCQALPVDHAHALRRALLTACPWLAEEPLAGIHTIHGASSGNGWMRPDDPTSYLPLSRRTRLALRLPKTRLAHAQALCGASLEIGPDRMEIMDARLYPLQPTGTVFARYVAIEAEAEEAFLQRCEEQLRADDIAAPRMMAGRMHLVTDETRGLACRSLMLDGLDAEQSLRLQQNGLGPHRLLGCGLFLPHKSIAPVAGVGAAD